MFSYYLFYIKQYVKCAIKKKKLNLYKLICCFVSSHTFSCNIHFFLQYVIYCMFFFYSFSVVHIYWYKRFFYFYFEKNKGIFWHGPSFYFTKMVGISFNTTCIYRVHPSDVLSKGNFLSEPMIIKLLVF